MGMYSYGSLMVGLPLGEVIDAMEAKNPEWEKDSFFDEHEIEVTAPYYDGDCDRKRAIAGFEYMKSEDHRATEFEFSQSDVDELKKDFKEITGLDAKLYIMPGVW